MNSTVIQAAQAVAVAFFVLAGQIVVARLSKSANKDSLKVGREQIEVDSQKEATAAWQAYSSRMEKRLELLEQKVDEQQKQIEKGERRIAALERQGERDKDLIRRLVERLRTALVEIKRLGGTVADGDMDLTDLAQLRLDMSDGNGDDITPVRV